MASLFLLMGNAMVVVVLRGKMYLCLWGNDTTFHPFPSFMFETIDIIGQEAQQVDAQEAQQTDVDGNASIVDVLI
jgi:hypothetical protein